MSDSLTEALRVLADNTSQALAGVLKAGLPEVDGKSKFSTGNSLPVQIRTEAHELASIARILK